MPAVQTLPRWDMSVVFPSMRSQEFEQEFASATAGVADLARLFDDCHIGPMEEIAVDEAMTETFDTVMERYSSLVERLATLQAYISAFVSVDSRDDLAQAKLSELRQKLVLLSQLQTRFVGWIGTLDSGSLIELSAVARDHEYMLEKARVGAAHLMTQPEEAVAADLSVTGGGAWAKLYDTVTSQLTAPIDLDGERHVLPISAVRNLALHQDRAVRRTAYEAEIAAWEGVAVPLAAALNSIKGETNALSARRGWPSPLDVALFNNNVDRETLNAMMGAARESFPLFRRYLRAKARALDLPILTWYDLAAPLGQSTDRWEFDSAVAFLLDQFGTYSSRLRAFGERAFREHWVDAEPREGKEDGAFCLRIRGDESRILANFVPAYDSMSTLAHELGHAYHNYNLAGRSPFQRNTPMTLAETASTFCETIVREAALSRASEQDKLMILEASLQSSTQVVVDITSRFLFETAALDRRSQRELSIDELCEAMLETQRQTYGIGLDQNVLHPFMWAAKGHYYSAGYPYYNFPYMFGLLFGLGLYARYRQDPEAFTPRYDDFLSSTGLADAATLAARFGIDVRAAAFWSDSLGVIQADVERFERLVETGASSGD